VLLTYALVLVLVYPSTILRGVLPPAALIRSSVAPYARRKINEREKNL